MEAGLTPKVFPPGVFVLGATWTGMWGSAKELDSKLDPGDSDYDAASAELDGYSAYEGLLRLGLPLEGGAVLGEIGLLAGLGWEETESGLYKGERDEDDSGYYLEPSCMYIPVRIYGRLAGLIVGPYLYWSADLELGGSFMGKDLWGGDAALSAGLSVRPGAVFELRFHVAGFRYSFKHHDSLYETQWANSGAKYTADHQALTYAPSVSVVFRI